MPCSLNMMTRVYMHPIDRNIISFDGDYFTPIISEELGFAVAFVSNAEQRAASDTFNVFVCADAASLVVGSDGYQPVREIKFDSSG